MTRKFLLAGTGGVWDYRLPTSTDMIIGFCVILAVGFLVGLSVGYAIWH